MKGWFGIGIVFDGGVDELILGGSVDGHGDGETIFGECIGFDDSFWLRDGEGDSLGVDVFVLDRDEGGVVVGKFGFALVEWDGGGFFIGSVATGRRRLLLALSCGGGEEVVMRREKDIG